MSGQPEPSGGRGVRPFDRGRRHPDLAALEDELNGLIEVINVTDEDRRKFLESRWRDQTLFMKKRVISNRSSFQWLRLVAVTGAVTVPALVSLNLGGEAGAAVRWITFVLSLLVAVATAWEQLYRFGRRWRLYRESLDQMRAEGWHFALGIGDYEKLGPDEAFIAFAERVEELLKRYSEDYMQDIAPGGTQEKPGQDQQPINK
jgi:hypothetical protein